MNPPDRPTPQRGEIWWAHFPADPPEKLRPSVIVSTNARNSHPRADTVLAVPLSTSIHKPSPTHLLLRTGETGLREDSIAWAENIGVVPKEQLKTPIQGHRPLTHSQICRLASMVRIAMGCIE